MDHTIGVVQVNVCYQWYNRVQCIISGLEIKILSREPNCIFKSYLKVLYTSLGSLQKFEGAAREFKGALGSPPNFEPCILLV